MLTKTDTSKEFESSWQDLTDLHSSLCASCAVPFAFNPARMYRNQYVMDGSFPSGMGIYYPPDPDIEWFPIAINMFTGGELSQFA